MSGFIGVVNAAGAPVDPALIAALTKRLAFRRPDGLATHTEGPAGFGLALFQTAGTRRQSCSIPKWNESTWIVADARLDGRSGLINKFDPQDRDALRSVSDPELILHCYRRWGDDCLTRLAGDFAFAIWDGPRQRLLCARDQFGVKPFFFSGDGRALIFSNTLECVRAHPGVCSALNELGLADFLLFGYIKEASATAFKAIKRLPAGHALVFEAGDLKVRRYWMLQWAEPVRHRKSSECVEGFLEVLQQAVADRVSLPQTGVLMSGGLDSTSIAALSRTTSTQVKAFSVVYDHLIPDEERRYAGEAASYLRVPIEYLAADDYELFQDAENANGWAPEPADEPLAAVFAAHMGQVRNFSRVALSGQGGDALFSTPAGLGVEMLRRGDMRRLWGGAWQYLRLRRRIPPLGFRGSMKRQFGGRAGSVSPEYPPWLNPDFESRLGLRERWQVHQSESRMPRAAPEVVVDPFWSFLFEGYDPGFTRIPVEVRHPFFDLRVVRFCMALDPVPWWIDKTLLRVAMEGLLPRSIRFRPKAPVAVDPVTVRLGKSTRANSWEASALLDQFICPDRVGKLTGEDGWQPWKLRPLALNLWLKSTLRRA
jgi:asparagine synthase (glutamine-hydrolysing)